MERRRFLHLLGLGAAATVSAAAVDPEQLLWVPGQKTFFLPPPPSLKVIVWDEVAEVTEAQWDSLARPGTGLISFDSVTREALKILENTLRLSSRINREYDADYTLSGVKVGQTLNVRKPLRS